MALVGAAGLTRHKGPGVWAWVLGYPHSSEPLTQGESSSTSTSTSTSTSRDIDISINGERRTLDVATSSISENKARMVVGSLAAWAISRQLNLGACCGFGGVFVSARFWLEVPALPQLQAPSELLLFKNQGGRGGNCLRQHTHHPEVALLRLSLIHI